MKIVLIGDSSVGKSALVYRFIHNKLLSESKATVGIAFFKQTLVDAETGEEYVLQIWDTAGQEKFQSVSTHHYRAADGALLVFDISNEHSFYNLDKWLAEIRDNTDPNVVIALVGTKVDLSQRRAIPAEKAQAYAKNNGLLYLETSSYWDKQQGGSEDMMVGVERVFLKVLRAIVRQQRDMGQNPSRLDQGGYQGSSSNRMRLEDGGASGQRSSCEC